MPSNRRPARGTAGAARGRWLLMALGIVLCGCPPVRPVPDTEAPYKRDAGAYTVDTEAEPNSWHDASRDRDVPFRVYYPREAERPLPLVVMSHGLGVSHEHYSYLGEHWASHGYFALFITHHGSDTAALLLDGDEETGLIQAAAVPQHRIDRPLDVSFAITSVLADRKYGEWIDPARIAVAGHSFGAFTSLAVIGATYDLPNHPQSSFHDERVRAAIAMSAQGAGTWGLTAESWRAIDTPCLTMFGSLDIDPLTLSPLERREPYDGCPGHDQFLITLIGATHVAFDDTVIGFDEIKYWSRYHEYVQMATIAFLDAYLLEEREAQRWLLRGSLDAYSGGIGVTESKHVREIEIE